MATKKEKKDILIGSILNELKELELLTKGMQDPKALHELAQKKAKNLLVQYKELQEIANSMDVPEETSAAAEPAQNVTEDSPKENTESEKTEKKSIFGRILDKKNDSEKEVSGTRIAEKKAETVKPLEPAPVVEVEPAVQQTVTVAAEEKPAEAKIKPAEQEETTAEAAKPQKAEAAPAIETTPVAKAEDAAAKPAETQEVKSAPSFQPMPATQVSGVSKMTALESLRKGISTGDKFLYIRELFKGDGSLMSKTIEELDNMGNINEAMAYIQRNFADWDMNDKTVASFVNLLYRRYA